MGVSRMRAVLRRVFLAVTILLVTGVMAGFVLAPAASAASGDFVITGRGIGHGEGLSQWGAWAAARGGVGYKNILAFYYPGTRLTSLGDAQRPVKVRITQGSNAAGGYSRVTLRPTVTSATLVLHGSGRQTTKKVAAGAALTATYGKGMVTIDGVKGVFDWVELRPASTRGRVAVALRATSSGGGARKMEYWGKLRVEASSGSKSLQVVNIVLLERYLRGVAEIDPGWANPSLRSQYAPEAVKAQQVAARSYAVAHSRSTPLYDNILDQVYLGYTWEAAHPGVRAAVEATTGMILTRNGRAIAALFCSSSGGYLSNTAWFNSGSPAYLVAKADRWSLKAPIRPWNVNPGAAWRYTFSPATLAAKLKGTVNVGTITKVEVTARDTRDPQSHAKTVRITGTSGRASISARVFRARLGLKSTLLLSVTTVGGVSRVEQTDSHLRYSGSWSTFKAHGASGGSYRRAAREGASVTVTFKGTYLAWIATKGIPLGKAYVSLDGKAAVKVDLSRGSTAYQRRVWSTGTLSFRVHTVKIWWFPGNRGGKYISIDAFEVKGSLR